VKIVEIRLKKGQLGHLQDLEGESTQEKVKGDL